MSGRSLLLGVLCMALAACGGGGDSGGTNVGTIGGGGGGAANCSTTAQRQFVFDVVGDTYLYRDLIPAGATPASAPTPQALLDFLTGPARAQIKRGNFFSFLTTITEDDAFITGGEFAGFGFGSRPEGGGMRITQVIPGSPAALAGFERGQVILTVDGQPVTDGFELSQAVGPPDAGVTRTFGIRGNDGVEFEVTVVKQVVTTIPVPTDRIIDQPGTPGIAYIDFRSFILTAESRLNELFTAYAQAGISDYIIDLRYNGGGAVSIAEYFGDLLGGIAVNGQVFYQLRFNQRRSASNFAYRFRTLPGSVLPVRIVFITTQGSASASELMVNGMKPHVEVAMVGASTFGKPVGQEGFDMPGCDVRLRPVTFDIANSVGEAGYFDGLPVDGSPVLCPAADDLDFQLGDENEASLRTALDYLALGACPVPGTSQAPMLRAQAEAARLPLPEPLTPAERYMGVY
jgi:carboxyl-terminal processing protease